MQSREMRVIELDIGALSLTPSVFAQPKLPARLLRRADRTLITEEESLVPSF